MIWVEKIKQQKIDGGRIIILAVNTPLINDWDFERNQKNGADLMLSGRTIQFTTVKYLVPVANNHAKLEDKKEAARTAPQQIKKTSKRA